MDDSKRMTAPRITVVTPSYNQGHFIEKTITSVLDQGYPNLEYLVMDGGSSDESVSIIRRYEPFLAAWVSEPDRGQSHAINKGFARSTGDILCWLNSDDFFPPGTLRFVAEKLAPGTGVDALSGSTISINVADGTEKLSRSKYSGRRNLLSYWKSYGMHQPSIFWTRRVFEKVGLLREDLHMAMDYEYWLRISRHFEFENTDRVLSYCHYHAAAKTGDDYARYHQQRREVAMKLIASEPLKERALLAISRFGKAIGKMGKRRK